MPIIETEGAASSQGFGQFARQVSGPAQAEAIDFDGTNDFLSRSTDLVGNTNGKTFTFSAWVWSSSTSTSTTTIYSARDDSGNSNQFQVQFFGNTVRVQGYNTSYQLILQVSADLAGFVRAQTFYHILISMDLANPANRSIYINDVAQSLSEAAYENQNIDFANSQHFVSALAGVPSLGARFSNIYFDKIYRDMSITANRRLFVTADLKPAAGQAALNPILYLPMSDPTAPGLNQGTGGNFTLTGTVARSGRGPNQYNAPYSDFDGSADFLSRSTAPTGIADGKQFTFQYVINQDAVGSKPIVFATGATVRFVTGILGNGRIYVYGYNSSGVLVLGLESPTAAANIAGRNYVITCSVDLSDSNKAHLFVNGSTFSLTKSPYTNDNINFNIASSPVYRVGRDDSTTYVDGRLGALWFNTSYIDLSAPTNLAKFVTGTGINAAPVDLGATGQLPTGTSPLIYLPMYGNNAGRNYGTGGDFTVNSGPYTGARGPNEYWGNWAVMSNSPTGNNALRRTAGVVGVANSKTFTLSFVTNLTSRPSSSGFLYFIGSAGNIAFLVSFDTAATGALYITGRNSSGTIILSATVSNVFADGVQYSVQISVDLNNSANRSIYVNGVARTVTWDTYTNAFIELAFGGEVWVGRGAGANAINGRLSEFYFSTEYVDFSQEANRLKFRDAFGNPVDLSAQITANSIPTPAIYMRFPPTSFGTNSGTGGNFTVNGTITDGGQL